MKLICIGCQEEFEDKQVEVVEKGIKVMKPLTAKEQAWNHTNRKLSKDSKVWVQLKNHIVFPITGRDA